MQQSIVRCFGEHDVLLGKDFAQGAGDLKLPKGMRDKLKVYHETYKTKRERNANPMSMFVVPVIYPEVIGLRGKLCERNPKH